MRRVSLLAAAATVALVATPAFAERVALTSPDNRASLVVEGGGTGPTYRVGRRGSPVLAASRLGFALEQNGSIGPGMRIVAVHRRESADRYWLPMGSRSAAGRRPSARRFPWSLDHAELARQAPGVLHRRADQPQHRGQTSPQILVRFRRALIDLHPAAAQIMAGINDVASNIGPMSIKQTGHSFRTMTELPQAHGIA